MDDPGDLFALLESMAEGEPEETTEALPRAGRYFADAIIDPEKITAAGMVSIYSEQRSIDPATGQRCVGVEVSAVARALCALADDALTPSVGTESIERTLLASATLLASLMTTWTARAMDADSLVKLEIYSRLALKAQEQQRKTLATLANIRSPKRVAFVKQLNQAINQQVNNAANSSPPAKARKNSSLNPNELLEVIPRERLDTRTQGPAISADPQLEALDTEQRP